MEPLFAGTPLEILKFCVVCATGCAASDPFLSPTRALARGRVVLDLGASYDRPVEPRALRAAREPSASSDTLREAATVFATHGAGVAPYVALRVGLGARSELTVAYLGTALRVGARKELYAQGNWVSALGVHLRGATLPGAFPSGATVPEMSVETSRVLGGDVILLGGYLRRNIYDFWFGPRLGISNTSARVTIPRVQSEAFEVGANRVEASFVFGLRINFGHVAVGMELDTVHTWAWGFDGRRDVVFSGFSLIPAGAVSYQF